MPQNAVAIPQDATIGPAPAGAVPIPQDATVDQPQQDTSWWGKVKNFFSNDSLYQQGRKAYDAVGGKVDVPGSFEGHPENVGEYVPATAGPIAQGSKNIAQGNVAKGAHQIIGGLSNAALPAAPFFLAGAPVATTIRALAGGAAGTYIGKEGGKALGLSEDQANLAGDVGGMAGGIGAVKAGEPVADALEQSAARNYQTILNPTKTTTKFQTQKIMPQLLEERPVAMTRAGMAEKAAGQAEAAGQQVEQAVSGLQGSMRTQPVIDGLENLRQSYQVNGVSLRPEVDSAIDTAQDQLRAISRPAYFNTAPVPGAGATDPTIPYQDVVKARRILDQAVAEVGGYQGRPLSDTSMANIRKATANSLREELGNASPDLAAVNAKFHFWNTLNDVLEQTIQRKTGQASTGLLPTIETAAAAGAGLAKGGLSTGGSYGAAMYVLGKTIRSTGWQSMSAAAKMHVADALANRDFDSIPAMIAVGSAAPAAKAAADTTAPAETPEKNSVPIASLVNRYDPVQARQAFANPVTQDALNKLNPGVADSLIRKYGVADTRKYFKGRNA